MTKVYFVRHAQPEDGRADDRAGPLTEEGRADTALVLRTLRDKAIDVFYCNPYKRCVDTIRQTVEHYKMAVQTDELLREQKAGVNGSTRAVSKAVGGPQLA